MLLERLRLVDRCDDRAVGRGRDGGIAGLLLGILSILGFRHAGKVSATTEEHRVNNPEYADATR